MLRFRSLVAGLAMVFASTITTTGTAGAQAMVFECRAELELYADTTHGNEVTGTEQLTNCLVVGHPGITSGTASLSGIATLTTFATLVTVTTDVITWNTGETTTIRNTRTFTGIGTVAETGTGLTTQGLLHPSADAEAGTGTRDDRGTAPEQEGFTIETKTINLITGFFDD